MIAAFLGISCLALVLAMATGRTLPRLWLGLTLAGACCGLGAAVTVLATGRSWIWRGAFTLGGENPLLRLDGISALFLVLL